ncbi:MAG: hypothetical protein PHR53_09200 [Bacteroidales bacterium]|nr:hypothetical protein [Bacteroidales bacterium]
MKKLLFLAIVIACMVSCKNVETPVVNVEEFAQNAATFVDQTVSIKGIAKHICHNSGRKLFLGTENSEEMVTVMANDPMPIFDVATEGKIYEVEGVVKVSQVIDTTYLNKWEQDIIENGVKSDGHVCSTEQKAEGIEIAENDENPELTRINAFREQIKANNGEPLTFYQIDCTSFKIVEE